MNEGKSSARPSGKSRVDRWIKIGFLCLAAAICVVVYLVQRNPPLPREWLGDLDSALAQASQQDRRVFVFIRSDPRDEQGQWLWDNIIQKSGNQKALEKGRFLRVLLERVSLDSDLAKRCKLKELPTLLVLDPQGKELNRRERTVGEVVFRNGFLDCSDVQRP